jgi:hypothetical protein
MIAREAQALEELEQEERQVQQANAVPSFDLDD